MFRLDLYIMKDLYVRWGKSGSSDDSSDGSFNTRGSSVVDEPENRIKNQDAFVNDSDDLILKNDSSDHESDKKSKYSSSGRQRTIKTTIKTKEDRGQSKAILAGCCVDLSPEKHGRAMSELKGLADACGLDVVSIVVQNALQITHATYIGSGKVQELKREIEEYDADIVIFNEALTPMQMRNLEKELDTEVLDRTGLILQIFASRARTREAKLQVESAQLQYMLPRLVGMRASLSRQGGGSGRLSNKGAGEQKLELDRRRIEKRIAELRRELEIVERERTTQRNRRLRTGLTKVALVGYTNAGKSTVMNALLNYCDTKGMYGTVTMTASDSSKTMLSGGNITAFSGGSKTASSGGSKTVLSGGNKSGADSDFNNSKQVFEADMLFATLDTSVRRIDAPGHVPFLLSDTVGFVSELPHALVKAFRSTLDEVRYADLLLEVVDFSDPDYREQIEVTAKTLEDIGAGNIPVVYLYNKTDLAMAAEAGYNSANVNPENESAHGEIDHRSGQAGFPGAKSRPIPVKIPFRRGETLYLAAGKGIGIPDILTLIDSAMEEDRIECRFLVPYTKGGILQEMRRFGVILSEEYLPEGTQVRVRCRRGDARRFQTLLKD